MPPPHPPPQVFIYFLTRRTLMSSLKRGTRSEASTIQLVDLHRSFSTLVDFPLPTRPGLSHRYCRYLCTCQHLYTSGSEHLPTRPGLSHRYCRYLCTCQHLYTSGSEHLTTRPGLSHRYCRYLCTCQHLYTSGSEHLPTRPGLSHRYCRYLCTCQHLFTKYLSNAKCPEGSSL